MRNNKLTTTKVHYKSYKAGKRWVFAGIATVAMGLGLTGMDITAHAADVQGTEATQTQVADPDAMSKSGTLTTTTEKKALSEDSGTPVTTSDKDDTPAPETNKDNTPAPETNKDNTPAPETNKDNTPAPETNKDNTPAPETNKDNTPAPETNKDNTPAPETNKDNTPAPEANKDNTPAPMVTPGKDETPAPVTTPKNTEMPKYMSRRAVPTVAAVKTYDPAEIQGKDASEWLPDAGLRDMVESSLKSFHNITATDANLYQYVDQDLVLDTAWYKGTLKIQDFEGLQYFKNLRVVDLNYYPKNGFINFDFAPNLTEFDYQGNAGDAPSDMDAQTFMTTYLSGNQNLKYLVIHNLLKGKLPDLSAYNQLSRLDFGSNHLTGDLTPLKAVPSAVIINMEYNQFAGELPDLVTGTKLHEFYLNNNQLSGTLNPVYGQSNLADLRIDHNDFTGDLPSFKGFTGLFYGFNNHFSSGTHGMVQNDNVWYQTLNGGTFNLTDDKLTFDPIKGVVTGIQDVQTGEADPTAHLYLMRLANGGSIFYGEPDSTLSQDAFVAWVGNQENVTSQFTRQATTEDPFGFDLIASKDVKPGTYTMVVYNDKYGATGGYIAYITFKITRNAPVDPVDPETPVDPAQTGTITIVNVDQDGKTLSTKTLTGTAGDTYTAKADTLDGYELTSPDTVTGTYTTTGSTITFTYAAVTSGGDGAQVDPDAPKDDQKENGKRADQVKSGRKTQRGQAVKVAARHQTKTMTQGQRQNLSSPVKSTKTTTLPQTNEHRTTAAWGLALLGIVLGLGGLSFRRKQN
ncbi:MucBP domain-containing protein [Levilactobacillus huananensis]|uniref:MucBP domain-containing protein n=1 Tax=Levilactobacillus huananensis TaxID=2486019 RepID=UPI000F76D7AA|nr:MucBP domain-containing protein [Levilactobacillus huananensis]